MIEICEAMIVFGRYDETEDLPKPNFGGSKGKEFDKWAERIERMFAGSLADIADVRHRILDVQAATWFDDILQFKTQMKDIEVVLENLTNAVFENVANMEEGIEALAALYNFQKRKTMTSLFESKTQEVCKAIFCILDRFGHCVFSVKCFTAGGIMLPLPIFYPL